MGQYHDGVFHHGRLSESSCLKIGAQQRLRKKENTETYILYWHGGGWVRMRSISRRDASRQVAQGHLRSIMRNGFLLGYVEIARKASDTPWTPSALTVSDSMTAAGTAFSGGSSRTACLTERQKRERQAMMLRRFGYRVDLEDRVEAVLARIESWRNT